MSKSSFRPLARVVAMAVLAAASVGAHADVASRTVNGSFSAAFDVSTFDLDITSASNLRLWTTSFAAGEADPVLAFFDRNSGALLSFSDDVNDPYPLVDTSQGTADAGIRIDDLAAGAYRVAVSVSQNLPAGASWTDGYLFGTSGGDVLTSTWSARLELLDAAPVPEPTSTALLLAGLAALGLVARSRRT